MNAAPPAKGILLLLFLLCQTALASGATNLVKMEQLAGAKFIYNPTNTTLAPGDTVLWTNTGPTPHDTTHNPNVGPPLWRSPSLGSAVATNLFSFTFTNAGFYPYYCRTHFLTHSEETGSVTVIAPNVAPLVSIINPS